MNPFLGPEPQRNLVLASASPRRKEILERLGFEFEVLPAGVDETGVSCPDHSRFATLLAVKKAEETRRARPLATIVAADTIVVCGDARLGKPVDGADASSMLRSLSGRAHKVVTGVAIIAPDGRRFMGAERTRVYFRDLSGDEVARYVATGEPFGKAGAYAIQGFAAPFIRKIEGCYFNVVGLPVSLLFTLLAKLERTEDDSSDR
jgi:septum formation protein